MCSHKGHCLVFVCLWKPRLTLEGLKLLSRDQFQNDRRSRISKAQFSQVYFFCR